MNHIVTTSPHIRGNDHTSRVMGDVLIALIPAVIASVVIFGMRALVLEMLSILTAVLGEWFFQCMIKQKTEIQDGSAAVTGLLLALTLPVSVPYYVAIIGSLFSIVVVKGICGGIGQNACNPALAGRAFLLLLFPSYLTRYISAGEKMSIVSSMDIVTSATPLHEMQLDVVPEVPLPDMFFGNIGGSIGEVSAFALLIGGIYLMIRKVISLRIPLSYLGSVAILTLVFYRGDTPILWMVYHLLGGGLILAAFFMATDYSSSPVTPKGQILYGIGAGALTVLFRYKGLFPEGVTYAILLMNLWAWRLDQRMPPRRFGVKKGAVR